MAARAAATSDTPSLVHLSPPRSAAVEDVCRFVDSTGTEVARLERRGAAQIALVAARHSNVVILAVPVVLLAQTRKGPGLRVPLPHIRM